MDVADDSLWFFKILLHILFFWEFYKSLKYFAYEELDF